MTVTAALDVRAAFTSALLTLAFLCELGLLVGLAVVGAAIGSGIVPVLLGIAFPVTVLVLWARLLAPSAPRRLSRAPRVALKLVLFIGTGLALVATDHRTAGVTLMVLATLSLAGATLRSDLA